MKFLIVILKFFFISALIIVSNENLALKDADARDQFLSFYYSWFEDVFENMKQVTSYVVNSHWLPDTDTFRIVQVFDFEMLTIERSGS